MSTKQHALRDTARTWSRRTSRCFRHLSLNGLPALAFALVVVSAHPASAQNSMGATANCAGTLFGSSDCQQAQSPSDTSSGNSNYLNGQNMQSMGDTQQRTQGNNGQTYVDTAGNQWQRNTSANDRNTQVFFPPDPITDFQKLARSSTGEMLTVFGRDMFQRAPSTFAPADEIPVTADYVLGPGDEVLVRLLGGEAASGNSQLTVDTSGNIYIPRVGTVHVAGLHANELQDRINTEVNRVFRNYRISVSLGRLRSIQVYVVGEARRPGAYTISGLSTVLNALFASGGPSVQGSMRSIQVRRGDKVVTTLDLYDLVLRGDKSRDMRLESGDTIFIPHVGPQVAIAGSVRHPAVYELREGADTASITTLSDLLMLAGGLSPTAAPGSIRLERIDPDLHRQAISVMLDTTGRATPLRDGDVLYADHISPGYRQSVTIRGNLANPGRFAWKPGMRLSDIIPDRESLLSNDYWRTRNSLGVPTPLFEPLEFNPQSPVRSQQTRPVTNGQNTITNQNTQSLSRSSLNAVLPPGEEGASQQAGLAAGGVISRDTALQDEAASNEVNNSGNSNTASNDGTGSDSSSIRNGNAAGQNASGTVNPNASGPQSPQQQVSGINRVRIPAPEIDWSYAVIERLDTNTLKTSLISFNLGRLVQNHDATQNFELQPNDVVTILNQRDILVPQKEQTKFVRLEGEFVGAGVYSAGPNETLADLVQRAGGFTSDAYLYGSTFMRESARVFQQQRLDEYITRLSADMERATAVRGASTPTGISDPNALLLERNIVSQLRQLRATGRVVLEFTPESQGLTSIPRIALENGDIFRVPSRPSTVSVIGAVYGQNVFLFNAARHLEDYLALAGKPNRIADKQHAFIIRADGSIFSRELAKGFLSNHFEDSRIHPGDSIVVPEKLIKPTALRQLLDYSQILSSFGLAAAAINVVR